MREIKFRAWNKKLSRFVGRFDLNWLSEFTAFTSGNEKGSVELQQFTGLRDKNGQEIYEGDILRSWVGDSLLVRHCDNHARFLIGKDLLTKGYAMDSEVIGNIHDNRELPERA